eukprot:13919338-Alexandrium_andersonii.AAC.1
MPPSPARASAPSQSTHDDQASYPRARKQLRTAGTLCSEMSFGNDPGSGAKDMMMAVWRKDGG